MKLNVVPSVVSDRHATVRNYETHGRALSLAVVQKNSMNERQRNRGMQADKRMCKEIMWVEIKKYQRISYS